VKQSRPVTIVGIAVAIVVGISYFAYLDRSPVYLSHDEIVFGSHGHAIATTGRDLNGRFFPLFFEVRAGYWATPVTIYLMALVQKILPLSEISIRLPTVLIGLTSVVLLYFIGRRVFQCEWLALVAAVLLALSPAHFIHSRIAVDHLYVVPFMLAWLLCLHIVLERYRAGVLFLGGLVLGVGFYSYLAAVVLMPTYFVITCVAIYQRYGRSLKYYLPAAIGFALPLTLLVPWLIAHQEQYTGQVLMYNVYDATKLTPLQGVRHVANWTGVTTRASVYYSFFSPSMLFFSGGSSLLNATRQAGALLLPLLVLLPLGMYKVASASLFHSLWLSDANAIFKRVLLAGFASAPLPSVVVADLAINRGLVLLPYCALFAAFGVEHLMSSRKSTSRLAAIVLLALAPLQFASFVRDYHNGYRARSAIWFEGNIRGAIEEVLDRMRVARRPAVYLPTDIEWIDWYWRFYLNRYGRQDLSLSALYFDPKTIDPAEVPSGSLVVLRAEAPSRAVFDQQGARINVRNIPEPAGVSSMFEVFDR